MERKKLIELIGSVFVALIFLSSYAAFGNLAPGGTKSTTTVPSQTFYAVASGNATIHSYSNVMNINISCRNVTPVSNALNSALASLEKNGSVSNFYSQQTSQILVQAGSESAYPLFLQLYNDSGTGAVCTQFVGSANINLPSRMTFYVPTQKSSIIIVIPQSLQTYSLPIALTRNMSGTLGVSVSALLTVNGSISGSLRVTQA